MNSDGNDQQGTPSARSSGRSTIPGRPPERSGEDTIDAQELKTVRLVCIFCREVRQIHVPVNCDTPKEVLWECLSCQERWASRK